MGVRVHPTAIVEGGVVLGDGTAVWDNAHLRGPGTRLGRDCIVGGKTYVAPGVTIGDRVKLNSFVYVCTAVTLGDGVFVGAGTTFTNDRFPRATTPDLAELRPSEADEHTLPTTVGEGASFGARCVVGCDLTVGRFAMVGMGAVVTGDVADHHLVVGAPARSIGVVCRCGEPVHRFERDAVAGPIVAGPIVACPACGRRYDLGRPTNVVELGREAA